MDLFVIKRDGCRVRFNIQRTQDTIFAAAKSMQQQSRDRAVEMANKVHQILIQQDVFSEHAIEIQMMGVCAFNLILRNYKIAKKIFNIRNLVSIMNSVKLPEWATFHESTLTTYSRHKT